MFTSLLIAKRSEIRAFFIFILNVNSYFIFVSYSGHFLSLK
ncbi:predicted protein [Listeria monocytogenes J2818]|nr:predicted protein [Listeria monocytogenes J2818]